jgi:hypothetical protein
MRLIGLAHGHSYLWHHKNVPLGLCPFHHAQFMSFSLTQLYKKGKISLLKYLFICDCKMLKN